MKVQEVMTTSPEACRPHTNLARAVELLWNADCGVLPVTDDEGRVLGVLTDRDICIALGTQDARASQVAVDRVMRSPVETCQAADDVTTALARMKERRVRRLPVVDAANHLVGILSLNDVVLAAGTGGNGIKPAAIVEVFKAVCAHRVPAVATPPAERRPATRARAAGA
jgi:CBS domain-containing protein